MTPLTMPVVTVQGVSKRYPSGSVALRGVNVSIAPGEFVFLTGPSGAGKSTLLTLLSFRARPTDGVVSVSGVSSSRAGDKEKVIVRRRLGIVFQDFRLLPNRSAAGNVAFALEVTGANRRTTSTVVAQLLEQVGLLDKAAALPHELSGGEQQRVAIARALANAPEVILADEPTGNLDAAATADVMALLTRINASGTTIIMATHDLALPHYPAFTARPARTLAFERGTLVHDSALAARAELNDTPSGAV